MNEYELLKNNGNTVIIRRDSKDAILSDLLSDFKNLKPVQTLKGRVEHKVYQFNSSNLKVIYKRNYRGGLLSFLNDKYFNISKFAKIGDLSNYLSRNKIESAELIALKITHKGIFKMANEVYTYIEGKDFPSILNQSTFQQRQHYLELISSLFRRLNKFGLYHNDLHPNNILLSNGNIILLDLASVSYKQSPLSFSNSVRQLIRFVRYCLKYRIKISDQEIIFLFQSSLEREISKKYALNLCKTNYFWHRLFWKINR